jgi:hypothetical protein
MFSLILFKIYTLLAACFISIGTFFRRYIWLIGLVLGLVSPSTFALPQAAVTAICSVLDDAKIVLVVGLILAVLFGAIASMLKSEKVFEMVLGVVMVVVGVYAGVYAVKGTNWANSLACVSSF